MSYSANFNLQLGAGQTGLTLRVSIVEADGVTFVEKDLTGVVEVGQGQYVWSYDEFDSTFRGFVYFYTGTIGVGTDHSGVTIKASSTVDPSILLPFTDGAVQVDHNYGGTDELTFLDEDSEPIDNATVEAFRAVDWDANQRSPSDAVGRTITDSDGHWTTPIMLDPGDYVILYYKQNIIQPVTAEITVE